MRGNLSRRVNKLEKATGIGGDAAANRWLAWRRDGRAGPEPAGREAAERLIRRVLLELDEDD
jgi:hypothetical protein